MDDAFESLTLRDIAQRNHNHNHNHSHGHHHRMSSGSASTSAPREVSFESVNDGVRLSTTGARRLPRSSALRSSARSTPDLYNSGGRPSSPDAFLGNRTSPQHSQTPVPPASISAMSNFGLGSPGYAPAGNRSVSGEQQNRRSGPLLPPHLSSLDIPRRYGGNAIFDLYSLTYVSDADVNLLCPICHDPLVDPITTPCDHTFCYRCIRRSIASSPSGTMCPIDREPLVWTHCFSAARLIRTQLNSLVVKCPYSARGCHLELRREAVEQHAKNECRFRMYTCPGAGCSKKIRYKPTDDKCRHEQDNCLHCFAVIEDAEREFHLLSCPGSKTRCQTCWQLVVRDSLDLHYELECDGVEVSCHYSDAGCNVRVMRGHLDMHHAACAFHPDTPTGAIIRTQRDLIQSYGDMGSQLREIFARQDEANGRLDAIVAALAYRGIDSGDIGGGGPGGGAGVLLGPDGAPREGGGARPISDLDAGFEEVHQNLTQLEARQSMWTLNQVMPIREEVAELRNNMNMLRMHVNWLLTRSRDEDRMRAATTNPGSAANSGALRPDNSARIGRVGLPDRRVSMEFDVPRL
ncbi:TNF receptor-associated factor 6 [Escovopsis weberi]|uniref:TNF receptor-associated factor 6 n=1 Tax=Escovopsis weberi TaxID=150374 RepID=A0A0M8N6U5_ESCWE|nr:TNF receptor-associated factor 6 [Escovopsis weberi]